MLSTTARPLGFNTPTTLTSLTLSPRHSLPLRRINHRRHSLSTVAMSSSSQIAEHVVLFNAKPGTESAQLEAMVNGLNGLRSLDMVLYLTTGPLLRNLSNSLNFTHMLHSRYRNKEDLDTYSAHDAHLSVVRSIVLPICDDLMSVDWITENLEGPVVVKPGSAMRIQFVKMKEGLGDSVKSEIFNDKFGEIEQMSYGEIFSARAKGFLLASLRVYPGVKELDAVEGKIEINKEVLDYIDSVVMVDYVVPSIQSLSL